MSLFIENYPNYMKDMFTFCPVKYNLHGSNVFLSHKLLLVDFIPLLAKLWNSFLNGLQIYVRLHKFKKVTLVSNDELFVYLIIE